VRVDNEILFINMQPNINNKWKKIHCLLIDIMCLLVDIKLFIGVFFFCFLLKNSFSQSITSPVVGAVTAHSAKILFLANSTKDSFKIDLEGDKIAKNTIVSTDKNGVCTYQFDGLNPFSHYQYTVSKMNDSFNNILAKGSFITYPAPNDTSTFSFTFGSCTEQHYNDSIFVEMQKHSPLFFMHLGDWLYQNNFKEEKFYYNESLVHQRELYEKRYAMPNMKHFLQNVPIDFVFDDEDGVYDDFSKYSYTALKMSGSKTEIQEISYPDSLRNIAINGLHTFFPNYSQNNHQVYHSFECGNTEFFFLDTRSTRSANSESFHKTKLSKWKYKVPKNHQILDSIQMNWLLSGLKNSKAQWKFIVSGVTFNRSYKKVFDICLQAQKRILPNGMNGSYVAASLATMWFAFPESQTELLNFCNENKIKNVIVLSGDAHTAAIDDGHNAGFPELMAGGLAQKNSKLAAIIKNNMRLNLWNKGGQGIGNSNFNDAFGKVIVNGNESVRLSAIDKYGTTICTYEVKDGFLPKHYKLKSQSRILHLRALKNLLRIALKN
jgi:hypothetical protein